MVEFGFIEFILSFELGVEFGFVRSWGREEMERGE